MTKYFVAFVILNMLIANQSPSMTGQHVGNIKKDRLKIYTITDASEPSSVQVMRRVRQAIEAHGNVFQLTERASADLLFEVDCKSRHATDDEYVCFYMVHYSGNGGGNPLMGGGVNSSKSPDEIALGFFDSLTQDIAEYMNTVIRQTKIGNLETCLAMTQSSCAVPDILIPELKTSIINLSQYVQKGGLKK